MFQLSSIQPTNAQYVVKLASLNLRLARLSTATTDPLLLDLMSSVQDVINTLITSTRKFLDNSFSIICRYSIGIVWVFH